MVGRTTRSDTTKVYLCIVTLMYLPSLLGFAVFGGFWGTWGASIPALREQAGLTDGQLGTALVCVGAGALPAMLVSGRLVDRWGQRATGAMLLGLGASGVLVAATARDLTSLALGLLVLGAMSGASDVAINAGAGVAQAGTGRPVLSWAHGLFSSSVVLVSLTTGLLRHLDAPLLVPFLLVAGSATAVALLLMRLGSEPASVARTVGHARLPPTANAPLLAIGALGALAFAVENGHQSWSALFFADVLSAGPAAASAGPAVFAAAVAVTRLFTADVAMRRPRIVVLTGAATAAAGTALLAAAGSLAVGVIALALAAAGTAVLFPTLLGLATADTPDAARGSATSRVTATAYLGFVAGPVYVGAWAGTFGLPSAMLALATLAASMVALAPIILATTADFAREPTTAP